MVDSFETVVPALLSIGMGLYVFFRRRLMAEYIAYWNDGGRGAEHGNYEWVPIGAGVLLLGMGIAMLLGLVSFA
jgi:hypothetical protein